LKNSKLPFGKTLANFDFTACPELEQRRILQLANQVEWVKRGENILFFGPSGGKGYFFAGYG
jgi:DNA replication protein DnaC